MLRLPPLSRIRLAALPVPGPGAQDHLRPAARPGSMNARPAPEHGVPAASARAAGTASRWVIVPVSFGRQRGLGQLLYRAVFRPWADLRVLLEPGGRIDFGNAVCKTNHLS